MREWKYILKDHTPVPEADPVKWARWYEKEKENCRVGLDTIGKVEVFTIFLAVDYNLLRENGNPVLFETLVRGGRVDGFIKRYSTWKKAEAGHKAILHMVTASHDQQKEKMEQAEADLESSRQRLSTELVEYFYKKFSKRKQIKPSLIELYKARQIINRYPYSFAKDTVDMAFKKALKNKHKVPLFPCIMDYIDSEVILRTIEEGKKKRRNDTIRMIPHA